ncbi:MAG: MOP flippase family protein [Proteobacteria bacterium]|nr:MOP flippase family protein [Pseudomonadota bacterium]
MVLRDGPKTPSLKRQAFSGVRWTALSSVVKLGLQLVQMVILARLLAPSDFGLMAIVASVMAFLQIFADAGVSNAIIHYQDIDETQKSSLYWLNIGASTALAAIVVAASPLIARFYGDMEIRPLLMLTCTGMIVDAAGLQIRIVAQKELAFAALTAVDLPASLVGFVTAVAVAFGGGGVYSLVLGGVATAVTRTALNWILLSRGWRPRLVFNLPSIAGFLRFGAYMIGNNLVNTFNSQVDIMLGGKLLGASAMGLYSVPRNLSLRVAMMINPIVTQVGMPVMAKAQGDAALLRQVYLQTIRMVSSVNFPIYVGLAVFAPEAVRLLLGEKWAGVVPLLQVFACWGLLRSTGNPVGSLLLAMGRADLAFKWNLVWMFITPPAIWIGSRFGATGMAVAMFGVVAVGFVPNWYFLVRSQCGAKFGEYLVQMIVPFVLSAVAGLAGFAAAWPFTAPPIRLIVGVAVIGAAYLALSAVFNRVWLDAMRELLGFRKGAPKGRA